MSTDDIDRRPSAGGVGPRAGSGSARRRDRAASPAARVARARQRPAGHPRARARLARGSAARHHDPRVDERHRGAARRLDARPDDHPARRHGRAADARGHRPRLLLARRRLHARLRSRHAHRDALRRRAPAERAPRRLRRPGAVHVPTRRGGPPRGAFHARRGAARRPGAVRRIALARRCGVRAAHHLRHPVGVGEHARRRDHGVGRLDDHQGDRQRRARQRAASRPRPHPGRLRDRPGAAADDHPFDRRVRPVGGHGRADHGRHDQQRDPRDGGDRGHDSCGQRTHASEGARRDPPSRRGHRRRPRVRLRGAHRHRLPGDDQRRPLRPVRVGHGRPTWSAPTRSCNCPTR